ncbi:hypothetical protein BC629DRAFT_1601561, partial [Irpex lacteus]
MAIYGKCCRSTPDAAEDKYASIDDVPAYLSTHDVHPTSSSPQPPPSMETVKNVAERMAGTAANGYHQSDVTDLSGRTALVTGGTGGIGFEVAKAFALANAKVFLLSRHEENADEAVTKIKEASSTADVHFVQCDLGNMAT